MDSGSPWARGVSSEARAKAGEQFDLAMIMVRGGRQGQAIDPFRKALAQWDHPAIHLELAKALMTLGESSDALTHLWAAMRYGATPLGPDSADDVVRDARSLLDTRVAHLVIRSDEVGVTVKLGTRVVLSGPGTWEGVMAPGVREISAQRAGDRPQSVLARGFNAGMRSEVTIRVGAAPTRPIEGVFAERRATDGDVRALQRQVLGYEVSMSAPPTSKVSGEMPMPSQLQAICARAKGDTVIVCDEYKTLHAQVERDRAAARKRIDEQTRGGVVDVLR